MFPIRDTTPNERFPLITVLLIAANVAVFAYELALPPAELERLIVLNGIVPRRHLDPEWARAVQLPLLDGWPFLTSMFLHGGWVHLISNVWTLWIFGDNVEDRLGPLRYLVFYVAAGLLAGLLHAGTNAGSTIPTIGASGAIAGVMGAYFVLFPRAQVLTVVPILIYPVFITVPALLYLGFWFVTQVLSGAMTVGGTQAGGVAWWAHVGGFLAGIALLLLLRDRPPRTGRRGPAVVALLALVGLAGCDPGTKHWRDRLDHPDQHTSFLAALAVAERQPRFIRYGIRTLVYYTDDPLAWNRDGARRGLARLEAQRPKLLLEYLVLKGAQQPAVVRELLGVFERADGQLRRRTLELVREHGWSGPAELEQALVDAVRRDPDWRDELESELAAAADAPELAAFLERVARAPGAGGAS